MSGFFDGFIKYLLTRPRLKGSGFQSVLPNAFYASGQAALFPISSGRQGKSGECCYIVKPDYSKSY